MLAIAASIILASGWRRRLIALAAGATGALAMAPFNFFPALAIPMTVAVWLIDGCAETRQTLSRAAVSFGLAGLRRGAPLAPDGGGALGISWRGSGGSARRFSSRRTNSPGPCRWASSGFPPRSRFFRVSASCLRGFCGRQAQAVCLRLPPD